MLLFPTNSHHLRNARHLYQETTKTFIGKSNEFAGYLSIGINRFADLIAQVAANGIAGKSGAAGNLPPREFVREIPTPDLAQNGHVNHFYLPLEKRAG